MKKVNSRNLNAFVANQKAVKLVNNKDAEAQVHLAKVVLKEEAFKHEAGVPFYAFVKQAGKVKAIVDVASGAADVFDNDDVVTEARVRSKFKIDGVTYAKKDTVDGFPRYKAVRKDTKRRNKKKLSVSEVSAAMADEAQYRNHWLEL